MQGQFIRDCIESVRGQRHARIEHLIFDACSTDCTANVVSEYVATYDLTFIQERDRGQAHAINKGLELAQGEIVCWLNSDDLFAGPDVVGFVVNTFQHRRDADLVTGGAWCIDAAGAFLFDMPVFEQEYVTSSLLSRRCVLTQPATFWKINAMRLDEDLEYLFDWKLWIDMWKAGLRFHFVDRRLAKCRWHDSAKTVTDTARRRSETVHINRYAGARAATVAWSSLIHCLYMLAEQLDMPRLKLAVRKLNNGVAGLTNHRLFSQ